MYNIGTIQTRIVRRFKAKVVHSLTHKSVTEQQSVGTCNNIILCVAIYILKKKNSVGFFPTRHLK